MLQKRYVCIMGSGQKGYYAYGMSEVFNRVIKNNIKGYYTSSSGCLIAIFIANGNTSTDGSNYYKIIKERYDKLIQNKQHINIGKIYIDVANELLPDDIHIKCNDNNVNIIATQISFWGIKKVVFNNFTSKQHLLNCVRASMAIPFITEQKFPFLYYFNHHYYLDGYLSGLPYCDTDDEQIVIRNHLLKYNLFNTFFPVDDNMEHLLIQGHNDITDAVIHNQPVELITFEKNYNTNKTTRYNKMKHDIIVALISIINIVCITLIFICQRKNKC
jgi:predicted patatin/cPLA2 family phospholipase